MWHDLNLVVLFYLDFHSIKKKNLYYFNFKIQINERVNKSLIYVHI